MSDTTAVEEIVDLEFDLPEPPSKVWRALTEPGTASRWMTPHLNEAVGDETLRYGVLDVETGSRVSYRWREGDHFDSVVTFSISVNAVGGTRLRIVQSQLSARNAASAAPLACRVALDARRPPRVFAAANLNTAALRRAA